MREAKWHITAKVYDRHAALGVVRELGSTELKKLLVHIVHNVWLTVRDNLSWTLRFEAIYQDFSHNTLA